MEILRLVNIKKQFKFMSLKSFYAGCKVEENSLSSLTDYKTRQHKFKLCHQ